MTQRSGRLKRHGGVWRVDGIGEIHMDSRLGTRTTVYFSALNEEGRYKPYYKSSLLVEEKRDEQAPELEKSKSTFTQLQLKSHTASLEDFIVGSVWKEGRRIMLPEPVERSLTVDSSQMELVSLDESFSLKGAIIPSGGSDSLFYMGENRNHVAKTLYAVLPVLDDKSTEWMIVPASELLRFYVGVSGRLLPACIQGNLGSYVDWEKSRLEGTEVILHVKKAMSRLEQAVLARAVASESAHIALHCTHQYLAAASANNATVNHSNKQKLLIQSQFPFKGVTRLNVSGKKKLLLDIKGNKKWGVFVMKIDSCAHPLGFSGITVESENVIENVSPPGVANGKGEQNKPPPYNPIDDGGEKLLEEDLSADDRLRRLVSINPERRFPDFSKVKIKYNYPKVVKLNGNHPPSIDVTVEALTHNEGNNSDEAKGNRGTDDYSNEEKKLERDILNFLDMLKYFRLDTKDRKWVVVTKSGGRGFQEGGETITSFPSGIENRYRWYKVPVDKSPDRPRHIVWVEILLKDTGDYIYLLEMELKAGESGHCTLLMHNKDFSILTEEMFNKFLRLTAIRNRWPDKTYEWKNKKDTNIAEKIFTSIESYKINHPISIDANKKNDSNSDKEAKTPIEKKPPHPKEWSKVLLGKIDEILFIK